MIGRIVDHTLVSLVYLVALTNFSGWVVSNGEPLYLRLILMAAGVSVLFVSGEKLMQRLLP